MLRRRLIDQVGGYPTPFQLLWIERAMVAREELHKLEARVGKKRRWTELEMKQYAIFDASFQRSLAKLAHSQKSRRERDTEPASLADLVGQHKVGSLKRRSVL
jgi:hypothetical protein